MGTCQLISNELDKYMKIVILLFFSRYYITRESWLISSVVYERIVRIFSYHIDLCTRIIINDYIFYTSYRVPLILSVYTIITIIALIQYRRIILYIYYLYYSRPYKLPDLRTRSSVYLYQSITGTLGITITVSTYYLYKKKTTNQYNI